MRRKREFPQGASYHVTSRTNDKIRVFDNKLGRRIMLITLQDAKNKYRFRLANFCIMPTHIHLLIKPEETNLSKIMQWIKTQSAKQWNRIHGSTDHMWGERYYARAIQDEQEYESIFNYIDQNPVVAGLAVTPAGWKAGGAYYRARNISGLLDFNQHDHQTQIKLLSPIPPIVSRLLPPAQLEDALRYFGAYAEAIDRLYKLIPTIPRLGESVILQKQAACLRYFSDTADYFIYEYDGENTMYGIVKNKVFPVKTEYSKFCLTSLKNNQNVKLDFSWQR